MMLDMTTPGLIALAAAIVCVFIVALGFLARQHPATKRSDDDWCDECQQRPGIDALDGFCSEGCIDAWDKRQDDEAEGMNAIR